MGLRLLALDDELVEGLAQAASITGANSGIPAAGGAQLHRSPLEHQLTREPDVGVVGEDSPVTADRPAREVLRNLYRPRHAR